MSDSGENYSARREAALLSTLLAILTELRSIHGLLARAQPQPSEPWMDRPGPPVAAAPPMRDVPRARPPLREPAELRDPRDLTDPAAGAEGYWPRGELGSPRGAHGAHRARD